MAETKRLTRPVNVRDDLNDLHQDNQRLRKQNQWYRRLIEGLPRGKGHDPEILEGLALTHEELRLQSAERAAELQHANDRFRTEADQREKAQTQITKLNKEIEDAQRDIILTLAEIVEARSHETGSHVKRVAELSYLLARNCGLSKEQTELVRLAAPMHDVGKVGIPDSILTNPGRLNAQEFAVMKTHTTIGYEMLKRSARPILQAAAVIALHHHEKYNGTGYPLGLNGERIHIFGRIVCIADVFDALSSDRVYRKAWDLQRIIEYFQRQQGESFDPELTEIFFARLDEFQVVEQALPDRPHEQAKQPANAHCGLEPGPGVVHLPAAPTGTAKAPPPAPRISGQGEGITRVLIADSNSADRLELERSLSQWGYEVTSARDGTEAAKILRRPDAPRLVVLDGNLPGKDTRELCAAARKLTDNYLYVIVATAGSGRGKTVEVMNAGADSCVGKPFNREELEAHILAAERILNLETALIGARESLRRQATRDDLTGLWNRSAILDLLARELDRAKREDISVGVVMGDLDFFKQVNDTHGHRTGDIALRETASRLRAVMRPYDILGRYGGEEFLVMLPRCDATFGGYVAERLRVKIASEPVHLAGQSIQMTISLGVAAARGLEDAEGETLIQAADRAMYRAKQNGRNRVEIGYLDGAEAA